MHCFRWLLILTITVLLANSPSRAQRAGQFPSAAPGTDQELDREIQRKMEREQQKKRFEQMKRDSQKLLELATELKQNVDKSGEHILSMDVMRKAEEMEKLARRIKENMRGQ